MTLDASPLRFHDAWHAPPVIVEGAICRLLAKADLLSAMTAPLVVRRARAADIAALGPLMAAAISELQRGFLTAEQIEASRAIMGLDLQLIEDGTYFVVHAGGTLAGCGGWSRRATLYGGSHSPGRDPAVLDPARDAARIRAMYTHPGYARRGVGRLILRTCETAALAEGFRQAELAATLSGLPLYRSCGYADIERIEDSRGGVPVPLIRMGKTLGRLI